MDVVGTRVSEEVPCRCTRPVFRIPARADAEQIGHIRKHPHATLVFGPDACAAGVTAALDEIAGDAPQTVCRSIVLASRGALADFRALIDQDRLFYLSAGALPPRELDALIESALGTKPPGVALDRFLGAVNLRRIALAQNLVELADALRAAVASAVAVARTRCVLFDSERNALWSPNETDGESTAVGAVSFILRTGATVCVPRLGDDSRFDRDLDGEPSDRFLGVPIFAGGATMAVLVAARSAEQPPFEPVDVAALEALAAHASPYVAAWLGEPDDPGTPFRRRALRELHAPSGAGAEPLRLEQSWARRATWLVVAAFAAFVLAFAALKGWLS